MIYKKTVFILGAGASKPYGYPTGIELKRKICEELVDGKEKYRELQEIGFEESLINDFRDGLFKSGARSIDSFLGDRKDDFMSIGKLVISQFLITYEKENDIYSNDDWYQYLFDYMWDGNLDQFGKNEVAFITFNYDRSLEHFMFTSLQKRSNGTIAHVAEALGKIPILHPYGKVGYLPWENNGTGREYYPSYNKKILEENSTMIRVISEGEIPPDLLLQSKTLLSGAYNILFLGFGFHKENLERIGMVNLDPQNKIIKGSGKGYTELQKTIIQKKVARGSLILSPGHLDALGFLEHMVELE